MVSVAVVTALPLQQLIARCGVIILRQVALLTVKVHFGLEVFSVLSQSLLKVPEAVCSPTPSHVT